MIFLIGYREGQIVNLKSRSLEQRLLEQMGMQPSFVFMIDRWMDWLGFNVRNVWQILQLHSMSILCFNMLTQTITVVRKTYHHTKTDKSDIMDQGVFAILSPWFDLAGMSNLKKIYWKYL